MVFQKSWKERCPQRLYSPYICLAWIKISLSLDMYPILGLMNLMYYYLFIYGFRVSSTVFHCFTLPQPVTKNSIFFLSLLIRVFFLIFYNRCQVIDHCGLFALLTWLIIKIFINLLTISLSPLRNFKTPNNF